MTDDLPALPEPVAWYCTSCGGLQLHEGAEAGDNWCSECGSVGTMKRMVTAEHADRLRAAVAQRDEQIARLQAEVAGLFRDIEARDALLDQRRAEVEALRRVAASAQAVTEESYEADDYFDMAPKHLMAAFALALDDAARAEKGPADA